MVVNQDAGIAREAVRARARARLRKTIRLRRAHYMRRRPLAQSNRKHVNYVLLFGGIAFVLFSALSIGTPLTAGLAAFAGARVSHLQLVLDPITEASIAALAPVLEILDRG